LPREGLATRDAAVYYRNRAEKKKRLLEKVKEFAYSYGRKAKRSGCSRRTRERRIGKPLVSNWETIRGRTGGGDVP